MKKYISERLWNIKDPMGGINVPTECDLPLINLGIGDLDITTDSEIIAKTMDDVKSGYTHYTIPQGLPDVRAKICQYHRENFDNYDFDPSKVQVTTSSTHGMFLTLSTLLNPGEEVLLIAPFFPIYRSQIELAGGVPVIVQTYMSDGYQITREAIESQITPKTKAIIVNSPNNPTGVVYDMQSLEILRDIAVAHDLIVIADDVYDYYAYDNGFKPIITVEGMRDRTVSICSFSKNFAMTGWRIGYVISDIPHFIETMDLFNQSVTYSAPAPSQRAAYHCLDDFQRIKSKNAELFKSRMEYAYERISKIPYMQVAHAQGGFYYFVNVSKTGMTGYEFAKYALVKANVKVTDGAPFGDPKCVRIACTVDIHVLKEAFDRLEKLIK